MFVTESAAIDEEPLPLPATPSPSVSIVSDDEPQAEVVDCEYSLIDRRCRAYSLLLVSATVDDTLDESHPTQDAATSDDGKYYASLPGTITTCIIVELAPPSLLPSAVVIPDNVLVVEFEHCEFPFCNSVT